MSSFSERRLPGLQATAVGVVLAVAVLCSGNTTVMAQQSRNTSNGAPSHAPSTIPDADQLVHVDSDAQFDMAKLSRLIVYPDSARMADMDGKVYVRVLVGLTGTVDSLIVQRATHPIFIPPSVAAIRSLRGKPAILNGAPVLSWITLPIEYRLK